ncbi:MAG: LPS export ABC transporter periplasmic protein LptC [Chlorobiaceae bacterium]|nr:LPS export ABC transporter periplasmic protein LptC [Chlorobiaceae bacterium]
MAAAAGCGDPSKGRRFSDRAMVEANHPLQETWIIRFVLTSSGKNRAKIEAGYGAEFKTASGIEYQLDNGIKVTFFDSNGTQTSTMTARKATMHGNRDIDVSGNVVLVSGGNTIIRTDSARLTATDGMIRSSRPVSISRPGEIIRGQGFESDQALIRYRIFQGSGEAVINK